MVNNDYIEAILEVWKENKEKSSFTIIGNSMSPMIKDGDILIVDHEAGRIFKGDIVIFKANSKYVAHRVVRILMHEDNEIFILKGDRSYAFDQPISKNEMIGKVVEIRGSNGHINTRIYPWKTLNYVLALLSFMSGESRTNNSFRWRLVRHIFGVRGKIFPKNKSIKQLLICGVCKYASLVNRLKITQTNMK